MRTDVKVGLVCVLALVLAVFGYFALEGSHGKDTPQITNAHAAPSAVKPEVTAPANSVSPPVHPIVVPPVAYSQAPIAQVPAPYSPPSGSTSGPGSGSTLYPAGSPRPLLPPVGGSPTVPPLSNGPTDLSPASGNVTPSMPPVGGDDHSTRIEPSIQPREPMLIPGPESPSGRTPSIYVPPTPAGSSTTYTVQNGDNLTTIAKKNHTTVSALKAANPTINPDRLKVKQTINLPAAGSTPPPTTRPAHSSTRPVTLHGPASTRPARHSGTTARPATVASGNYKVRKGDTLRKIAKAGYGDEKLWRRIFRANRGELANPNDIAVGMVLKIPAK